MSRKRPRRSSLVSAAGFGYFIFHPIRPTEIPTNWYGSISKPIRWAAPPSPASRTSERRSNHQCFPCNAIPTKSDRSSTNPPSNMPPECLHTYVPINSVDGFYLGKIGTVTNVTQGGGQINIVTDGSTSIFPTVPDPPLEVS